MVVPEVVLSNYRGRVYLLILDHDHYLFYEAKNYCIEIEPLEKVHLVFEKKALNPIQTYDLHEQFFQNL